MVTSAQNLSLQSARSALTKLGVIPSVAELLQVSAENLTTQLYDSILEGVPAYTDTGNPDVLPELKDHLAKHIAEICRLLGSSQREDFSFVRNLAHRRAEQKFPLDAVLSAYQVLHKVLARRIRDAALQTANKSALVQRVVAATTDFNIEYAGAIATICTSEYVSQTRVLAEAEGDRRTELLGTLLGGYDESDRRTAELLRQSGYLGQRQHYCVAVVRSVNPQEMTSSARVQRMVESVGHTLRNMPGRSLLGVKDDLVISIISATRRKSGWTAPQSLLAERVYPLLRTIGPAVLIGLSSDAPSTSHIPRAFQEAKMALDFAKVGRRVRRYSNIPFRQIIVHTARESAHATLPSWLAAFLAADKNGRGILIQTLQSYADNDMNVLKTAAALELHPNTIYARMQKIADITGKSALSYHALTEMLLATEYVAPDL